MSWLSSFVNNNRNFAGNALKNVAPLLALTGLGSIPAGYLLAGGAGALGQGIKKGSNIGDILHAGVDAGSMGSGLQTGAKMAGLKNAFAPSSQVAGAAPNIGPVGMGVGMGGDDIVARGGFGIANQIPDVASQIPNTPVSPWYKRLGITAKDEFMKDPITGLRVAGGIAGLPGDMRKNDAEAKLLQQQAETQGLTAEQLRQQKANMDALRNALTAKYNQQ